MCYQFDGIWREVVRKAFLPSHRNTGVTASILANQFNPKNVTEHSQVAPGLQLDVRSVAHVGLDVCIATFVVCVETNLIGGISARLFRHPVPSLMSPYPRCGKGLPVIIIDAVTSFCRCNGLRVILFGVQNISPIASEKRRSECRSIRIVRLH